MGHTISVVRESLEDSNDDIKKTMEQRLNILEKMVEWKLQNETTKILTGEPNDQEIHAGTVVRLHKQIYITESEKTEEINRAIHEFLGGDWIEGLEEIVTLGAEAVLANATMGEYESTEMVILWTNNALLRCDAYYYRWNFVSKNVIDQAEGVIGVVMVQRVIDITKVDPQVLLWAISQQANRAKMTKERTDGMIDSAVEMMDKVLKLQMKVADSEKDIKKTISQ